MQAQRRPARRTTPLPSCRSWSWRGDSASRTRARRWCPFLEKVFYLQSFLWNCNDLFSVPWCPFLEKVPYLQSFLWNRNNLFSVPWCPFLEKVPYLQSLSCCRTVMIYSALRIRIRDLVPFWPLDPGFGMGKKINIRIGDEHPGSYFREI